VKVGITRVSESVVAFPVGRLLRRPVSPAPEAVLTRPVEKLAARGLDWAVARTGPVRVAILVSGFWRSGTTWLQECLAEALDAKPVFEALSPQNPRWAQRLDAIGIHATSAQEATMPGGCDATDPMWRYLDGAFRGVHTSGFGLASRQTIGQSLRRLVVAKEVRLQLNLAAAHARYGAPVAHLRRHPCAVVASLLQADWSWRFADVSLADATAGFPEAAREAARGYDTDELSRIAAYWALSEGAAEQQLAGAPWARIIAYEQAVQAPDALLEGLCRLSGHPQKRRARANRDSVVTHPDALGLSPQARRERWRGSLSTADTARVEAVVRALAPALADRVRF